MLRYQADVVVIGSGIAGVSAAIELLERGRRVLLIDRDAEENMGGLAKESFGGIWFAGTPKKIRLMVGLHILKHRFDLSDEEVVQGLHENVYWMGFCGVKLQPRWRHEGEAKSCRFLDRSTMTKFRRRLGAQGFREMEDAIREILICKKRICPRSQFADTTAQPKHIEYPTDTELLHRGRDRLVRTIKRLRAQGVKGIDGVRSFSRLSRKVIIGIHKLGKDRKERIESGLPKLSGYAQEVMKSNTSWWDGCGIS